VIDGAVGASEWSGAQSVPLGSGGNIYFKNDAINLYLLVDFTADTVNDPPTADWSWLAFDNNDNAAIDPELDTFFTTSNVLPNPLRKGYMLGPGVTTGLNPTASVMTSGFGTSPFPGGGTPHRIWEYALRLNEIGRRPGQRVDFGVRVHSQNPAIDDYNPVGFMGSFASLIQIRLTTRVAYIYNTNTALRDDFVSYLQNQYEVVDPVAMAGVGSYNFAPDQVILVGDDTGSDASWGDAARVAHLRAAGKPVIGLGRGGFALFGQLGLSIGYPFGATGGSGTLTLAIGSHRMFRTPHLISVAPTPLYTSPQPMVTLQASTGTPPLHVTVLGMDTSTKPNLAAQSVNGTCYLLWGFAGGPSVMTPTYGGWLLLNALGDNGCVPRVAYLYKTASADNTNFMNLLRSQYTDVQGFALGAISQDLATYDTIVLAADTGDDTGMNPWLGSTGDASKIASAGRPVLGIGAGGAKYFFLLHLSIGFGQSWTVTDPQVDAVDPGAAPYGGAVPVMMPAPPRLTLYSSSLTGYAVYVPWPSASVAPVGRQTNDSDHYPLISQKVAGVCYFQWGFDGNEAGLTPAGQALFGNLARQPYCLPSYAYLPLAIK
jgi:hypothetical protein